MNELKPGRKTLPSSAERLLPILPVKARHFALKAHLAHASLRQGFGNVSAAGEVLKTLYIAYHHSDAKAILLLIDDFATAEEGLKMTIGTGAETGSYTLGKGYWSAGGSVFALHDQQLDSLPLHRREAAHSELRDLVNGPALPNLVLLRRDILDDIAEETAEQSAF